MGLTVDAEREKPVRHGRQEANISAVQRYVLSLPIASMNHTVCAWIEIHMKKYRFSSQSITTTCRAKACARTSFIAFVQNTTDVQFKMPRLKMYKFICWNNTTKCLIWWKPFSCCFKCVEETTTLWISGSQQEKGLPRRT